MSIPRKGHHGFESHRLRHFPLKLHSSRPFTGSRLHDRSPAPADQKVIEESVFTAYGLDPWPCDIFPSSPAWTEQALNPSRLRVRCFHSASIHLSSYLLSCVLGVLRTYIATTR